MTPPRASKGVLVIATVLATGLAAVGCSSQTTQSAPELPSPAPTTSGDASGDVIESDPETNKRGYIVKELGEQASIGKKGQTPVLTFTIDKIVVDPPCEQYGRRPPEGHTLVLHMRLATGSSPQADRLASAVVNPFNYAEIGSNGVTHQARSGSCTDPSDRLMISNFGINQKYRGTIELTVPEASGILTLAPDVLERGGWEWHY